MDNKITGNSQEISCTTEKTEKNLQHAGGLGAQIGGVDPNIDKELIRLSEGY